MLVIIAARWRFGATAGTVAASPCITFLLVILLCVAAVSLWEHTMPEGPLVEYAKLWAMLVHKPSNLHSTDGHRVMSFICFGIA